MRAGKREEEVVVAIMREPADSLVRCELTFIERQPIDVARARAQHRAYRAELERLGCRVVNLPPDERHPDSCFVEDTAVVLDEIIVLTNPGARSRRGEVESIAPILDRLRPTARIGHPATLDGGDVVRLGRSLWVGLSTRTNEAGAIRLAELVAPRGYRVTAVPFSGCLHFKSGCTAVDDETVLLNPAWVDPACFAEYRVLEIDEEEPWAADLLPLGGTVLMNATCPRTIAAVERSGYRVTPVDLSEFMKAEAGVTCLSLVVGA